jgi:hypothetical protein
VWRSRILRNPAGDMYATGGTLLLSLSCKRRTGYPR